MNRPYVICHMTTSIDGKVTGDFLNSAEAAPAVDAYYEINRDFRADAYACGRITMEGSFTGGWMPDLSEFSGTTLPREDYVADPSASFFAVSFDRRGRLGWKSAYIEDEDPGYGGAHIIEVLCEEAPDAYLAYLRKTGISYIFAGKGEMDIPAALGKLKSLFGIDRLLLEGGSILNGAFQRAGMIDELSLVIAPVTATPEDKPLFGDAPSRAYVHNGSRALEKGVIHLNYAAGPAADDSRRIRAFSCE